VSGNKIDKNGTISSHVKISLLTNQLAVFSRAVKLLGSAKAGQKKAYIHDISALAKPSAVVR